MKDFDEPGSLAPTGLHLGGSKYMVIQGESGAVIRGKKVRFGSSDIFPIILFHLMIIDHQRCSFYFKVTLMQTIYRDLGH